MVVATGLITTAAPTWGRARGASGEIVPPAMPAIMRSLVRVNELLTTARVVWLSTTRPDGRPHVVPVWFDWDGEHVTVFTRPDAQKVRNIRHEPRVMLAVSAGESPFEVELFEGEASLAVPAARNLSERFRRKYGAALSESGQSLESFAASFPTGIRIRPTRLLDWAMRG